MRGGWLLLVCGLTVAKLHSLPSAAASVARAYVSSGTTYSAVTVTTAMIPAVPSTVDAPR